MKLLNITIFISIFILFACKKEEEKTINPCANGKKDNGETEVDCGGPCKACATFPYMVLRANGETKQANQKDVLLEGSTWVLTGGFDTTLFQINIGSELTEGINPINALNTGAVRGTQQMTFVSGVIGISEHNVSAKKVSGNFEAIFANGFDTLRLEDGQFEFLEY
jgi:hypothetical protein